MRIGLLITSVGNFGEKGFYNTQEIGLAKELDKLFDEIVIYKAVSLNEKKSKSLIGGCAHSTLYHIPVRSNGINGVWDCSVMDPKLDALIYFSDTQLAVPKVYKWCCQNNIQMYPYIGVIESHSTSAVKMFIINVMFQRNIAVYRKCTCFVKTPTVAKKLKNLGIKSAVLTPVGLDTSLLYTDYEKVSAEEIKKKYGYQPDDKILLFIGRLINEKQPLRMIDILRDVRKKDQSYKLLVIGTGELKKAVEDKIREYELSDYIQVIERVPNSEIWELYRMSDAFVNLNQQEIFGMAILEAMYYGCKVVAWEAPGPNLIIENGKSGWLTRSNVEVMERILNSTDISNEAHQRVLDKFTWESSARKIFSIIGEQAYEGFDNIYVL